MTENLYLREKTSEMLKAFTAILRISQEQVELSKDPKLMEDSWTKFLGLLEQRRELMDMVDSINLDFVRDQAIFSVLTLEEINCYRDELQEMRKIIIRTQENDSLCQQMLQEKVKNLRSKMGEVKLNKKASETYGSGYNDLEASYFFDYKK